MRLGMNSWLNKAWHDPVGSKLIAGVILGVPTALTWLWSRSDFSTSAVQAWMGALDGLRAIGHWFTSPAPISRLTLLVIVAIGVMSWWLAVKMRRRLSRALITVAENERRAALPPIKLWPETFSYKERLLLHLLYREYRTGLEVRRLGGVLGLQYPAAEKLCEEMAETELITVSPGGHSPPTARLTKVGRDYCLEKGLDQPPAWDESQVVVSGAEGQKF